MVNGTSENGTEPSRSAEAVSGDSPQPSRKARTQHRAGGRAARLSYDDWVDGALAVLAREGVSAIRIPRLCAALGVTKGSFYWHFDDIDQLMAAMTDRWTAAQSEAVAALATLAAVPVTQRIEAMAAMLVERTWLVESTVREWARTHPRIAAAVTALDQHIFTTVRSALIELGCTPDQARLRAGALVYLGIGFIHGRDSLPTPTRTEVRAVLDLLTRPGGE